MPGQLLPEVDLLLADLRCEHVPSLVASVVRLGLVLGLPRWVRLQLIWGQLRFPLQLQFHSDGYT